MGDRSKVIARHDQMGRDIAADQGRQTCAYRRPL
jgi:hypothetical protein